MNIDNNTEEIKKQRIVNVIGMGQNARWLPDYGERWGINHAYIHTDKMDKWFIMDGVKAMYETAPTVGKNVKDIINFARDFEMEIISAFPEVITYQNHNIRTLTPYPIDKVMGLIPGAFINSSIVEILAYACVQEELGFRKVDLINLYGIELWSSSLKDEHNYQKQAIDFWIAFCYGRGIQINIPAWILYGKDMKENLYGYQRNDTPIVNLNN